MLLGETSFPFGVIILSFSFSAVRDAKMTNQQSKQGAEAESTEVSSSGLRTSKISAKEELVLHSKSSPSFDCLELNCECNKAVITRNGQARASLVVGEPLQKYQSLDFGSILFGSCPSALPINTASRCHNSKGPVKRTKSTPFELIQQMKTNELAVEDGSSCLESQLLEHGLMELQAQKVTHASSEELNYSLPRACERPACDASCVPQDGPSALREHLCMSLAEDPYFSSSPPNSAGSKMSFDLPERQDGATSPGAQLPASSAASSPYSNPRDSLIESTLTSFPPPINQETAIEGKLFF